MDGRTRVALQVKAGVRPVLEDVDYLRMTLGCSNVIVLTPKVETRMRYGYLGAIPLQLSFELAAYEFVATFPRSGFPESEGAVITVKKKAPGGRCDATDHLQNSLCEYLSQKVICESETRIHPTFRHTVPFIRELLAETLGDDYEIGNTEDSQEKGEMNDTDTVKSDDDGHVEDKMDEDTRFYTCMKCRLVLFDSTQLVEHAPAAKDVARRGLMNPCTSYFIEDAPEWLPTEDLGGGGNGGKLMCPQCDAKVGQWSWSGGQCSCGSWVVPNFQFTKTKIDEKFMYVRPLGSAIHNTFLNTGDINTPSPVSMSDAVKDGDGDGDGCEVGACNASADDMIR
jgi:hypothetical protein